MSVGARRQGSRRLAWASLAVALAVLAVSRTPGAAARPIAYCTIPTIDYSPWGFHTGSPISGPAGSYARGHGSFNPVVGRSASGIICQVDRVRGAPDRQIILSVGHRLLYYDHVAVRFGVPGNLVKLAVRVRSSTDARCAVGTRGQVTIFASYNGVHRDSVAFWFPAGCEDHRHYYRGPSVVTNVEPA